MEALVALINPQMPRVHGDGIIHFSHFDAVVHHDGPLWIHKTKEGEAKTIRGGFLGGIFNLNSTLVPEGWAFLGPTPHSHATCPSSQAKGFNGFC